MTQLSEAIELAKEDVNLYLRSVERDEEAWKRDHKDAMACLAFEATLRRGLHAYDMFAGLVERWGELVLQGRAPYDPEVHRWALDLYRWWTQPCDKVERALRYYMSKPFEITDASRFRAYCSQARAYVSGAGDPLAHLRGKSPQELFAQPDVALRASPEELIGLAARAGLPPDMAHDDDPEL